MRNPEFKLDNATGLAMPQTIENIFGLRRGGNHVVINWLEGCYEAAGEASLHENDVYSGFLPPELQGPNPDPSAEDVMERAQGYDVLILSYEDVNFAERQSLPLYPHPQLDKDAQATRDTVVIRDWFNLAASRLTYQVKHDELAPKNSLGRIFGLSWVETEALWLDYARIVSETDSSRDVIVANYNQWVAEREYREELARKYDLPNSEDSIHTVPFNGSGSSFDGRNLNGNGNAMNVLRRWEDLDPRLVERYKRLVSNPALADLNWQLFGIDQEEVISSLC